LLSLIPSKRDVKSCVSTGYTLFLFYEFHKFETGDGAFGIFGAFFLDGFLAFDRDAETATLAFLYIVPVYLIVKEIQKETPDNREPDNPDGETNKVKHTREVGSW
jgi:hypothetical protein